MTSSEGTLVIDHDRIIAADLRRPLEEGVPGVKEDTNASATSPVVSDVRGHQRILEDFLLAVKTDGRPLCDGHEGRRSLELVQAIYQSSRSGRPEILVKSVGPRSSD